MTHVKVKLFGKAYGLGSYLEITYFSSTDCPLQIFTALRRPSSDAAVYNWRYHSFMSELLIFASSEKYKKFSLSTV